MSDFKSLGLSSHVLKAVKSLGFDEPTPIQRDAIPLVLSGKDVMGLAQTGTGKTAAFGLPLVHHLLEHRGKPPAKTVRSLVLAPTRELVSQIAVHLKNYVRGTPLRVECIMGGTPINRQIRNLSRGADVLVATPGRLIDLIERDAVVLNQTTFLVLDEADQMLDMGFIQPLRQISQLVGDKRQTMLFSATMPRQMESLSRAFLNDPIRVETARPGMAAEKIAQSVHFLEKNAKAEKLIESLSERMDDLSLVFSRTKHGAEKLMKQLNAHGFSAESIHGNKSQAQRERALKRFRNGNTRILVATDVAARGIDIPGVTHVYNYDLPEVAENYVHRIGRTARAGAKGMGIAFCSPEEIGLLRAVEKVMSMKIDVASGEVPADSRAQKPHRGRKSGGRPSGRNGGPSAPRRAGRKPHRGQGGDREQTAQTGERPIRGAGGKGRFAKGGAVRDGAPRDGSRDAARDGRREGGRREGAPGAQGAGKSRFAKSGAQGEGRRGGQGAAQGKKGEAQGKKQHRGQRGDASSIAGKHHTAKNKGPKGQGRAQGGKPGGKSSGNAGGKPANANFKKRSKSNAKRSVA